LSLKGLVKLWRLICPETRLTELLLGLCALCWTFLLTVPGDLFATNATFLGLANKGGELRWGCATGCVALLHLAAWLVPFPPFRLLALSLGTLMWGFLASSICETSPRWHYLPVNTGFYVYSLFGVFAGICMCYLFAFLMPDLTSLGRTVTRRRRRQKKRGKRDHP
jgi:hypothetical protein